MPRLCRQQLCNIHYPFCFFFSFDTFVLKNRKSEEIGTKRRNVLTKNKCSQKTIKAPGDHHSDNKGSVQKKKKKKPKKLCNIESQKSLLLPFERKEKGEVESANASPFIGRRRYRFSERKKNGRGFLQTAHNRIQIEYKVCGRDEIIHWKLWPDKIFYFFFFFKVTISTIQLILGVFFFVLGVNIFFVCL